MYFPALCATSGFPQKNARINRLSETECSYHEIKFEQLDFANERLGVDVSLNPKSPDSQHFPGATIFPFMCYVRRDFEPPHQPMFFNPPLNVDEIKPADLWPNKGLARVFRKVHGPADSYFSPQRMEVANIVSALARIFAARK